MLLGSAQVSLGQDWEKGLAAFDEADWEIALQEFTPLAEQGHPDAQFYLGLLYRTSSDEVSLKWFRLAAEQGHARAMWFIGDSYCCDDADVVEELKWYRLSVEHGDVDSRFDVAWMYEHGRGVPQDYVYAHMWYNIAAAAGHEKAIDNRDVMNERMTPDQIAEAQKLARECVAKDYKGC